MNIGRYGADSGDLFHLRMDLKEKLNPIQMVARAVSYDSSLSENQISQALHEVLEHLMLRAEMEIHADCDTDDAVKFARQYQTVSETVLFLGTQLIAFDDIEAEDDINDGWNPGN